MADFVGDFLEEADARLSEASRSLAVLNKKPEEKEAWTALESFFDFIRSIAPFAGFHRSYLLSDAAVSEIKKAGDKAEVLTAVQGKFLRIESLLNAARETKREDTGTDEDLLPLKTQELIVVKRRPDIVVQPPEDFSDAISEIQEREAVLDKREEELVFWKQSLVEQENNLIYKERFLQREKQNQLEVHENLKNELDKALTRLSEQEKIQNTLEEHLAEAKLALQNYQEKISGQETLQKKSEGLLALKDKTLSEMDQKIQDLTRLLEEKKALSEQREEELYRELQKNREQNEKLRNSLEELEETSSEINENNDKLFSKYARLEKEYRNTMSLLDEERRVSEQFYQEKRELERQHVEFNARMVVLQERLTRERENVKNAEMLLERQKKQDDILKSELHVSGWPYNPEKIQKELALIAVNKSAKVPVESLEVLKKLTTQIRTHSFAKVPQFFEKVVQVTSERYNRPYEVSVQCDVQSGVDKDALLALKQILVHLTENAFHYAFPVGKEPLRLAFRVRESDLFLHCSFSDNGGSFDFDRLYTTVQTAGLTEENVALTRAELLAYLFHNAVQFKEGKRGLTDIACFLEKAGGRIEADFNVGLKVEFSLPKRFLFDKVLLFRLFDKAVALPLTSVAETIFLKEAEIRTEKETGRSFFYWKGMSVPVLRPDASEENKFGLIIQAGAFYFLLPVRQISDTEHLLSISEEKIDEDHPFMTFCTVLESEREVRWLDIPELLRQNALPLPRNVVPENEEKRHTFVSKDVVSYLIFKSSPETFGAVQVDAVLRVEDFLPSANESVRKQYLETQGVQLPLKDSCSSNDYLYAQAVLIFKNYALAVHEVADIIEVPHTDLQNDTVDFIVYHGRKVPVFPAS